LQLELVRAAHASEYRPVVLLGLFFVNPLEWVRRVIRRDKLQDQKFVIERCCERFEPVLDFASLLKRVFVPALSRCRPSYLTFIRHIVLSVIDSGDANGNWFAALSFEVLNLIFQIAYDAPNLADHCLLNDLYLNAYFNRGYLAPLDDVARDSNWRLVRHNFAEGSITAPRDHADARVSDIQNRQPRGHAIDIFWRAPQLVQIFEKLNRYVITLRRCSMTKNSSLKKLTKRFEQLVLQP